MKIKYYKVKYNNIMLMLQSIEQINHIINTILLINMNN